MARRVFAVGLLAALCVAPTAAAQAPRAPVQPRIAHGVSVVGVDLGGLTVAEASQRLNQRVRPRLQTRFDVLAGGRRFVLTTGRLQLRFDEVATARRALRATRGLAPGGRARVEPVQAFKRASVRAFAEETKSATTVAPRNARIRITVRRIHGKKAHYGRNISARLLEGGIVKRLKDPATSRTVRPRFHRVRPRVRLFDLRRTHRTILTIDRGGFRLRVFKRLRYDRSYGIAVGAAGTETPAGIHRVLNKQVNPPWTAPNRPWAGSYAGRTVPGGAPDNPLKARWLGLGGGVGIHGTGEPWTIGSSASHGCIRMRVPDVMDLYPRVPVGTSVLIR